MIKSLDWAHIFLLGWRSPDGKLNLTKWQGKNKWIDVAIIGATNDDVSKLMWNAYLHKEFELRLWPDNGIHAFGWHIIKPIIRQLEPVLDYWQWYNDLKGIGNV